MLRAFAKECEHFLVIFCWIVLLSGLILNIWDDLYGTSLTELKPI